MVKQRGVIAAGWIWLVGSIIVLGLIYGIEHGITGYLHGITEEAYKAGENACDTAYKARDNAVLTAALARVQTLEEQARKAERDHSLALGQIELKLKKERENGQTTEKRVLDDIAAGRLRVRGDAFQARDCPAVGGGSPGAKTEPGATRSDADPQCRLSETVAAALLAIGREADAVVAQLTAAQQVIIEDRRVCGP